MAAWHQPEAPAARDSTALSVQISALRSPCCVRAPGAPSGVSRPNDARTYEEGKGVPMRPQYGDGGTRAVVPYEVGYRTAMTSSTTPTNTMAANPMNGSVEAYRRRR
jgi:hypothetical protein